MSRPYLFDNFVKCDMISQLKISDAETVHGSCEVLNAQVFGKM